MYYLDKESSVPVYQQLYSAIRQDIIDNPAEDKRLPSVRSLSKELGISINTVNQAYQQLLAEGYIRSVPGSGYYVNTLDGVNSYKPGNTVTVMRKPSKTNYPIKYNFQYGLLGSNAFPWSKWKECIRETLMVQEDNPHMNYEDKQGIYHLRESIAGMVSKMRGVKCVPEQIVVCSGTQDALRILTLLFPASKYDVAFEEPGYSTGRNVFHNREYRIHPITYTERGLDMEELKASGCRLVYLTPSHQFPTGHIMPIANRYDVLNYINSVDGYVIEDDYDSEFRYKTRPIPPLYNLDTNERTIFIGTFSKSFNPTLRVAYLILPRRLLSSYNMICRDHKTPVSELVQYALSLFITKGYYLRHVRRIVRNCERNYDYIRSIFVKYKPRSIRPIITNCGVHIMLEIDTPMSEAELLAYLEEYGIRLYPTSQYWYSHKPHPLTLQMGFAAMTETELNEGLRLLFSLLP